MTARVLWPNNKSFAFTIFDDTDHAALPNIAATYQFLEDIGMRTTKSVWPLRGPEKPVIGGATCDDPAYLDWALGLQERGFEIGLHNVAFHSSLRQTTIRGFERFRQLFGHDPYTLANHAGCAESIYWGSARLTGLNRLAYNLITRGRRRDAFHGHVPGHPLFWGDVCHERVSYARNFVYGDINTLKACPWMPYYDPDRPYVRAWFASSEGPACATFCKMLNEKSQDQLALEGGACIMYTHLAFQFCVDGRVDPSFRKLMERLSKMNGWFVPVRTVLDYLAAIKGVHTLTSSERSHLERKWLAHKLTTGST